MSVVVSYETYEGCEIEIVRDPHAPDPALGYAARVDGHLLHARPSALRASKDASAPVLYWATPEAARVSAQRYVRGL